MARACGSYPQCHRFKSSRRYHTGEMRQHLSGIPLERRPVGQEVKTRPFHGCNMGSSPVRVTTSAIRKGCRSYGGLAQLVRAPASHAGGHWFESSSLHQKVPDFVRNQELFLFMPSNSDAAFWRFSHDPNRDPKADRSGKRRRGADGIIRPSRTVFAGYMVWLMTLPMVSAAERFIPSVAWV